MRVFKTIDSDLVLIAWYDLLRLYVLNVSGTWFKVIVVITFSRLARVHLSHRPHTSKRSTVKVIREQRILDVRSQNPSCTPLLFVRMLSARHAGRKISATTGALCGCRRQRRLRRPLPLLGEERTSEHFVA